MSHPAFFNEIYLSAKGEEVECKVAADLEVMTEAQKRITEHVKGLTGISLIEAIALIAPMAVPPKINAEYLAGITYNMADDHAKGFVKSGAKPLADTMRVFQNILPSDPSGFRKAAFSLAVDEASPIGYSVNCISNVLFPEVLSENERHYLGYNDGRMSKVKTLFSDKLAYGEGNNFSNLDVISNLLNTYIVLELATKEKINPKDVEKGAKDITLTYVSSEGFVPASWFEIFNDMLNPDFNIEEEIVKAINNILEKKDIKLSDFV